MAQSAVSPGDNLIVAGNLRELADLLETQDADHYRIEAYRRAADTVASLDRSLNDILAQEGLKGLDALPGIGRSIAGAIAEMLSTGRWVQLDRLRGTVEPEALFCTVPGIGPALADRIHQELHIDTLEALEAAAHDGRLARVSGMGRRRIEVVKATLAERLGRRRIRPGAPAALPSVADILSVDREYRSKAAAGRLKKIAPKRFNPSGAAWLDVLHARRGAWIFTALFSNTRRAHELERTTDWVVIYFHTDGTQEGQCTVVTEFQGALTGKRVVRGREAECADHYRTVAVREGAQEGSGPGQPVR